MPAIRQPAGRPGLRSSAQRGSSALELALAFPLLMVCLFGGLNYGMVCYDKSVLANASREAARFGTLYRVPTRPSNAEITAVANRSRNLMISFDTLSAASYTVDIAGDAPIQSGSILTVTVRYQFQGVARGLVPGMGNGLWLSASTAMTYE